MSISTAEDLKKVQRPVRCLVIQLARLGDTLQSLMALKAAKQLYPQLEIHFLARERFASAARRVPWIEEVITLPTDDLLGPVVRGEAGERQALLGLAEWLEPLTDEPWDLLMNWSYSDSSSYLTAMIPATVKLGYTRAKDQAFLCADGWSHYMQAIVQGRVEQNIHLTDILTTQLLTALQIHVGDPVDAGDQPVNSKGFFSVRTLHHPFLSQWRESTKKWIALQLGAGKEEKTWSPKHYAELAEKILTRHSDWSLVILGGSEDREKEKQFFDLVNKDRVTSGRIVSLVGQTDFDLWASVVSKVHWVIAGDTAVIHLASVLGTRVLNLSIGPAKWTETGPYGNGHYVLAPQGGQELNADQVYEVWHYAITDSVLGHLLQLDHARIFRSRIRPTEEGGGVVYEPLVRRPLEIKEWTALVMGQIARTWFCGWVAPVGHELTRDLISPELLQQLRQLEDSAGVLMKICEEAAKASQELALKSAKLRSDRLMKIEDKQVLDEVGRKVLELDSLIERIGKTQDPFRAFSQMSKVMMHNLNGDFLSDLGKESAVCYRNLREGVRIFKDWLDFTLKMARPVALRSDPAPVVPIPN